MYDVCLKESVLHPFFETHSLSLYFYAVTNLRKTFFWIFYYQTFKKKSTTTGNQSLRIFSLFFVFLFCAYKYILHVKQLEPICVYFYLWFYSKLFHSIYDCHDWRIAKLIANLLHTDKCTILLLNKSLSLFLTPLHFNM